MSNEIKPQVGDVWQLKGNFIPNKIYYVGNRIILYGEGEFARSIEWFMKHFEIVERDGKPYPPKKEKQGEELVGCLCYLWNSTRVQDSVAVVKYFHDNDYWINELTTFSGARALTKEEILQFKNFEVSE